MRYKTGKVIVLLLPIIIIVALLYFMIGWNVALSLTGSKGLAPTWRFTGLQSYRKLLDYSRFWIAIKNNLIWVGLLVGVTTPLALVLAYLINLRGKTTASVFRPLFLYALALSPVVTGTIWTWMYSFDEGVINTILRFLNLHFLAKPWLDSPQLALFSVVAANVWQLVGFGMILYLAALAAIPSAMVESAQVEGASGFQVFFYMIMPNIGHATLIVTTMLMIFSLKMIFPLVWVMTRGAPINATEVLPHLMFVTTFERVEMSMGAAINIIIFLIAIAIVLPYANLYTKKWSK